MAIQRKYEADTPAEAELAPDPVSNRPGRVITENSTLYQDERLKKKVAGVAKLKKGDVVIEVGQGLDDQPAWRKIRIVIQANQDVSAQKTEGYIKASHVAPLFRNQEQAGIPLLPPNTLPSPADVKQGAIGDCYLLAALMTISQHDPQSIVNMFQPSPYDPAPTDHAVRFYTVKMGADQIMRPVTAKWVRVTKSFPTAIKDVIHLKTGTRAYERGPRLWPAMIEKAYAVFKGKSYQELGGAGFIMTNIANVMAEIGGKPHREESAKWEYRASQLGTIEGETAEQRKTRIKGETALRTIAILNKGGMLFVGTGTSVSKRQKTQAEEMGITGEGQGEAGEAKVGGLASGHAYAVEGLEKEGGRLYVKLRNPWAEYGRSKYGEGDKYQVVEGPEGAVSYVEIGDFLDAFAKIHHTFDEATVGAAIKALQDSQFLQGISIGE